MKCRIIIILAGCCFLILFGLAGCQLAKADAGADAGGDRLVGVFITKEYLDLFDFEGYMNDNFKGFEGGEIDIDGRAREYQGRLYATLVPGPPVSVEGQNGDEPSPSVPQTFTAHEYIFEGLEGIAFFVPTVQATEEENSYITTESDPAVSDVHINIHGGDDESSLSVEGTIYIAPTGKEQISYYVNPVYQSADGSVYVVSGDVFMTNYDSRSEGPVFSQTVDEVVTRTENGKSVKDSISIKVSVSLMFAPLKTVILQMDADNALISRTEFEPDQLPDVFSPEKNTAYFIVEAHKKDETGAPKISREIYGSDAELIEAFYFRPDGAGVKQLIQIVP